MIGQEGQSGSTVSSPATLYATAFVKGAIKNWSTVIIDLWYV